MDKKIIGFDLANIATPDKTIVNITFRNNGKYDKSAVNMPIIHEDNAVGVITSVTDDFVNGYIFDLKFYQEFLGGSFCGVSIEIGNEREN